MPVMTMTFRVSPVRNVARVGAVWLLAACLARAEAVEEPAAAAPAETAASAPKAPSARYVLGLALAYAPEYNGGTRHVVKPRPLWAWQRGAYRISSSGANTVLGFGSTEADTGAGASADFAYHQRWRFGAGLRIDNGRRSSDSADLAGIPDVRRTVRMRLYSSYTLDKHWSGIATVSEDLLGRGGGGMGSLDVGYSHSFGPRAVWSVSTGLRFGDARYMGARYGISPEVAAATGRTAFEPGAGVESLNVSAGLTTALSPNWILFGSVGASTLRGGAAASPLTTSRTNAQIAFGIGWRNTP